VAAHTGELFSPAVTWASVALLREKTRLPLVLKGILAPEDALRAVEFGVDAVVVSNHGGRQLDQVVATAHCVEAVRDAVGDSAEVYVDGGIRSGLHALIALALGADAVFVGRPLFHALAADGREGVDRAFEEYAVELTESMRLAGCAHPREARGLVPPGLESGR
jgi:4-hydroxymandelate oxidase